LADASLLLNAVTSENTRQAMRLRSMGDAWSVVTVNEAVYPSCPSDRSTTVYYFEAFDLSVITDAIIIKYEGFGRQIRDETKCK
jgi:hypothetical protein